MAGRGTGRALLTTGLLGATLLGGAGGYSLGLLTGPAVATSKGAAAPLEATRPTSTTPPPVQVKTPKPDDTPPLVASDLTYTTRRFTAVAAVTSKVSVRVPRNWRMTQPYPQIEARFTDPTTKRWIRVEAGFTVRRAPTESMAARVAELKQGDPVVGLKIISQQSGTATRDDGTPLTYSTLTYSYIPGDTTRYVIVRWVALDKSGMAAVEMTSTGLQQDRPALLSVLQHATDSVVRTDS
ncbi:MAG: hypothetical protein QOG10_838 [Kribbellaceae bacterium]|nr:hypothetical protein [Kribbellaceae bacterium]